jgi:hypothetical protein
MRCSLSNIIGGLRLQESGVTPLKVDRKAHRFDLRGGAAM